MPQLPFPVGQDIKHPKPSISHLSYNEIILQGRHRWRNVSIRKNTGKNSKCCLLVLSGGIIYLPAAILLERKFFSNTPEGPTRLDTYAISTESISTGTWRSGVTWIRTSLLALSGASAQIQFVLIAVPPYRLNNTGGISTRIQITKRDNPWGWISTFVPMKYAYTVGDTSLEAWQGMLAMTLEYFRTTWTHLEPTVEQKGFCFSEFKIKNKSSKTNYTFCFWWLIFKTSTPRTKLNRPLERRCIGTAL